MLVTWAVTQSVRVVRCIQLLLFGVSAVAIRKAKPASILVSRAATQSVLRCNQARSMRWERGVDMQGEACVKVSHLGTDLVSSKVQPSCIPCDGGGRGSGMQGEAV